MSLELRDRVVVIRFQRQVAALSIALEQPSFLQESGHTETDGMDHYFERIDVWRFYPMKTQAPIVVLPLHAIKDEHREMIVHVKG